MPLWEKRFAAGGARVFGAQRDGRIMGFASGGAIREALQDYEAEL